MPYPFINREVKGAFRWYEAARLRHRNRVMVTDPDPGTALVAALPFPKGTILPFQIRCDVATNTVVSWRMYDLASPAVEQFDLDSHIPELVIAQYANPDRAIICLETPLIDILIPSGRYEMEIVTNTGATLYSETFEILCGKVLYSMPNSALSSGTTNWGYGDWAGLLGEVITGAGVPPRDGTYDDEQVANLTDNLLYTWNGTIWNSSTPVNGTYWSAGIGTQWYIFTGGAWASAVTPPIAPAPDSPYGAVCWNGTYAVPWVYTPPAGELPGFVKVQFTPFSGPFAGSFDAYAGDTLLGNFTTADNGVGQEFTVYLEAGDDIYFIPSSNFDGCITNTNFEAVGDGTECMTKLQWSNCGDLGTTAYAIGTGAFTNILYLRENDEPINGNVWDPIPTITVSPETNQRGDSVPTRSRKDVNWTLFSANLPRHLIDAVSEIPTVDSAYIRAPWAAGQDEIVTARVEVVPNDMIGDLSMIFQVDEATVNSGCCDVFDRPCAEPCGNADGIYGIHALVEGNTYLYTQGRIATYCGMDCEEHIDLFGFNNFQPCPYGFATTSDPNYPLMRWNGTAWVALAEITSITATVENDCTSVIVIASLPSGYIGQLESTTNGVDWEDIGVSGTAAEFAAGVEVSPPVDTVSLRLNVIGADECSNGTSLPFALPCVALLRWFGNEEEYGFEATSSTGYILGLAPDGTSAVYGSGSTLQFATIGTIPRGAVSGGWYSVRACDSGGVPTGEITDWRGFHSPLYVIVPANTSMGWLDVSSGGTLNVVIGALPALTILDLRGNALVDVDTIINSIVPTITGIEVHLEGGTSVPRTSASDVRYEQLVTDGGGTITTN